MSTNKQERREKTKRMIALTVAVVMVFSAVAAAVLSQIW